jgi:hypothetical protein
MMSWRRKQKGVASTNEWHSNLFLCLCIRPMSGPSRPAPLFSQFGIINQSIEEVAAATERKFCTHVCSTRIRREQLRLVQARRVENQLSPIFPTIPEGVPISQQSDNSHFSDNSHHEFDHPAALDEGS